MDRGKQLFRQEYLSTKYFPEKHMCGPCFRKDLIVQQLIINSSIAWMSSYLIFSQYSD